MSPEEFLTILLDVVADKTGYPLDLLEPTMDIEADLGIDSIKRVEILSALQEKIPNLPEVDLTEVAALRTLGEIASYIEQHGSEVAAQASAQANTAAPAAPTMTSVNSVESMVIKQEPSLLHRRCRRRSF
jgi:acyl carrier protein